MQQFLGSDQRITLSNCQIALRFPGKYGNRINSFIRNFSKKRQNFYLRYDTRHATRAYFYFYARHENQKNYDTRHATREFVFFMRDTIIKKIMIRDTRHATRVFI